MAAVLLEPGSRLLHIGPHKTGTTAIQGALHPARERLAAEGVVYPGRGRQPLWPILAVTGQPALLGGPRPEISYWDNLVREIRAAGDQRVVLSSEFFAEADDATARRVIADLGGARVHVVVTLRSLTRILPSQWQQYLQNGFHFRYLEWLEGILSDPPRLAAPQLRQVHALRRGRAHEDRPPAVAARAQDRDPGLGGGPRGTDQCRDGRPHRGARREHRRRSLLAGKIAWRRGGSGRGR